MQCVTQGALAQRLHDLHPCRSLLFTIRAIPFPRLHLLSEPCPVVKMPFLASFSFRAQASGAFYKSIGGSYPKLTSAYCDSSKGPVLGDNTLPTFLSTIPPVFGAIGTWRDKAHYPEMPSFSPAFPQS